MEKNFTIKFKDDSLASKLQAMVDVMDIESNAIVTAGDMTLELSYHDVMMILIYNLSSRCDFELTMEAQMSMERKAGEKHARDTSE